MITIGCAALLAMLDSGAAAGVRSEPVLRHIMVIWGENTRYATARAEPNLAALAGAYAEFTNYSGVAHPSMPNYLALTSGAPQVATNVGCTSLSAANLADLMENAGLDWRGYNESMGTGCVDNGSYFSKHDFFVNYASVRTNPAMLAKVRGFEASTRGTYSELLGANPPELVLVTPNICNDGHDCGVGEFGQWLAGANGHTFFQDMLASKYYTDGAIFIAFDEDDYTDGNHVYCVAIGEQAKAGFADAAAYTHYSLLRTIEDNFGLPTLTANDAGAANMLGAFDAAGPSAVLSWDVQ